MDQTVWGNPYIFLKENNALNNVHLVIRLLDVHVQCTHLSDTMHKKNILIFSSVMTIYVMLQFYKLHLHHNE